MADLIQKEFVEPLRSFFSDSKMFLNKCDKPTFDEFNKVGLATAVGFTAIGFLGFFVKLFFIPINNVIIGQ